MFDYKTVKGISYSFTNVWWHLKSTKLEYLTFITISETFIHDSIHLKTTRGLLGFMKISEESGVNLVKSLL